MILQISDDDSLVIRCLTFDNMPKMHDFYVSIHGNHLCVCRNGGQEMKIHLGKPGEPLLHARGKEVFSKLIKSEPLKQGTLLIKLEKE